MDLHDIAEILAPGAPGVRLRQGAVTAIAADGTLSVTIGGGSTVVAGVKAWASVCAMVGSAVWLATDGTDLMAIATIAPVGPAYCAVRRASDQSIANATETAIDFLSGATVEADTHGMFSTSASDRLTVAAPGTYRIAACLSIEGHATGYRYAHLYAAGAIVDRDMRSNLDTTAQALNVSADVELAAGDVIQVKVRHTAGVSLSVLTAAAYSPRLSATWLRPVTS